MFKTENNPDIIDHLQRRISISALITVFLATYGTFGTGIPWGPSVSDNSLLDSASALMVEWRSLHTPVPVFHLGVLHHVIKCLQALHHSEDTKHSLETKEMG